MYFKTILITFLINLIPQSSSQLLKIDGSKIFDVNSHVLLVDKCSTNHFKKQCESYCSYKVVNNLKSFKEDEDSLLNFNVIKLNKDGGLKSVEVKNDFVDNNIFVLVDKNVTFRLKLSNRLDTNIYIFNNKTKDNNCDIWILNLDLTSKY